jgi:hypothetical protein
MTGVPETATYTPLIGSTTWPSVTLTSIRNAGWQLALEVD